MTPEQAAAAIADVGDYRQGLTNRAAGTIWMVWGLALAVIAAIEVSMVAFMSEFEPTGGFHVETGALGPVLVMLTAFVAAIVASNAIWKSHAIANDETHRPWIAWATAAGIVAVFEAIGLTILFTASWVSDGHGPDLTYIFVSPLFSAGIAAALTFMLRKRTRILAGVLASLALELVVVLVWLFADGRLEDQLVFATSFHSVVCMLAFGGVGLHLFRRG